MTCKHGESSIVCGVCDLESIHQNDSLIAQQERIDWFINSLNNALGMTALVERRYPNEPFNLELTYFSPTMVELGSTTITVGTPRLGDIVGGTSKGCFMSQHVSEIVSKIRQEYRVKFPNAGA